MQSWFTLHRQFLRIHRNCLNISDFDQHLQNMAQAFKQNGYPMNFVSKSLEMPRNQDRCTVLFQKNDSLTTTQSEKKVFVIQTFNLDNNPKTKETSILFFEFLSILREKLELIVGGAAIVGCDVLSWQSTLYGYIVRKFHLLFSITTLMLLCQCCPVLYVQFVFSCNVLLTIYSFVMSMYNVQV